MCLLVNGKPTDALANGSVPLPFGAEYKIRLRNKDKKRRVVAKVFVDGENVAEGGVIVPAGGYVDLDGPVNSHKNFKFVSLDSPDAIDFGKNGPNHDKTKGVIEAHFHFEKEKPQPPQVTEVHHHHHHTWPWVRRDPFWYGPPTYGSGILRGMVSKGHYDGSNAPIATSYNASLGIEEQSLNACSVAPQGLSDGCTVEGSHTSQSFGTAYVDIEEAATVLKMFLQGYEELKVLPTFAKPSAAEIANAPAGSRKKREKAESAPEPTTDAELDALRQKRLDLEKALEKKRIAELEAELGATA